MSDTTPGRKALVTNDDGIDSAGIEMLAEAAAHAGFSVTVAAPPSDSSGTGASLAAMSDNGRAVVQPVPAGNWPQYVVHGSPAFIVRAAVYGAFGPPPDVVLSGINRGRNTGQAIIHSGTVGAALTAAIYGKRAIAFSADVGDDEDWSPSASVVAPALSWLARTPEGTVLNVNVPQARHGSLRGVRATLLANAGQVQGAMVEPAGDSIRVTFSDERPDSEPGTDNAALAEGFVSVTAIRPVCDDERFVLEPLVGTALG